ncbi:MAG TPA: hypothetical protein ENO12_01880 [Thermoplasmatales archaeon]|nr:hypothetical protein [Thermoplasmatales archaeon]
MTRHTDRDLPKLVGSLTRSLPLFLFRFGLEAFRLKHRAYKAARIYRRELVRQGLNDTMVHRLTQSYLETSDPFKLLRAFR